MAAIAFLDQGAQAVAPVGVWLALGLVLGAVAGLVFVLARPYRVEASFKATTRSRVISLGAGVAACGLSGSVAAVVGGPGVVAVHFRSRELHRRTVERVTLSAMLGWLDGWLTRDEPARGRLGRAARRVQAWLLARTDLAKIPDLGVGIVLGLRDVSLRGTITYGSADPGVTGRLAAWLYPIAGVLAPLGALDVTFDWSGEDRLDGEIELSFRFVPARVALEVLRFGRRHFHLRRRTLPAAPIPT